MALRPPSGASARRALLVAFLLVAALTVSAALPGVASARQSSAPWDRQVRQLLRHAGETLGRRGLELLQEAITGSLSDGQTETQALVLEPLPGGYEIWAVCDTDCSDIDLELVDLYGDAIDRDVETDDVPTVQVTPMPGRTRFRLRVTMVNCSSSPCWYGVGVFGRPARK